MKLLDGHTVGIDLGTAYSSMARLDDAGQPAVIPNAAGNPITSSVVVLERGGRARVGPPDRFETDDPTKVIVAVKRQMGNPNFFVLHEGRRLSAEFLSAMILKKLKRDAEAQIGPVANAVVTVPYYFNDACRRATVHAGQIAGLNVIDILNEPTAATLAYVWLKGELGRRDLPNVEKSVLVYDLGGGTFDVTLVKYTPTHFRVVATDGDSYLGGLDWTRRLVDYAAERFADVHRCDPREDPLAFFRLTEDCEAAKRELSTSTRTMFTAVYRGKSQQIAITRRDMERLTADLLQRTRDTTELVLEMSGTKSDTLDEILLVGGSTKLPGVHAMLERLCGRAPSRVLDPQLAVAQGAAIHAAIIEARETGGRGRIAAAVLNRLRHVTATDVNSHSLGVEITDAGDPPRRRNHIMIPRNTPLPRGVKQRFVTNLANPQSIRIRLLEGEVSDVTACTFVGEVRVSDLPPNLPVGSPVEVTYSYDATRRIHVAARELSGHREASIQIVWDSGGNQEALEAFRTLAAEYQVD